MTSTAARTARAARRAALAISFALAACASAPDVAIVAPAPGSTLGPTLDLDPTTPGIQLAVDATSSHRRQRRHRHRRRRSRPRHRLQRPGPLRQRHLRRRRHPAHRRGGRSPPRQGRPRHRQLRRRLLRLRLPHLDAAERPALTADPGDAGLVGGGPGDLPRPPLPARRWACSRKRRISPGQLQSSERRRQRQLQRQPRSRARISSRWWCPASDLRRGPGHARLQPLPRRARPSLGRSLQPPRHRRRHRQSRPDHRRPMQADISVRTDCADGTPASLLITSSGTVLLSSTATVQGGSAVFPVTLPDGVLEAQAFVGAPGQEGVRPGQLLERRHRPDHQHPRAQRGRHPRTGRQRRHRLAVRGPHPRTAQRRGRGRLRGAQARSRHGPGDGDPGHRRSQRHLQRRRAPDRWRSPLYAQVVRASGEPRRHGGARLQRGPRRHRPRVHHAARRRRGGPDPASPRSPAARSSASS